MSSLNLSYCLMAALIWASSPLVFRACQSRLPSLAMVALRGAGFVLFGVVSALLTDSPLLLSRWELWFSVAVTILSMGGGEWLYVVAVRDLGPGLAAAVSSTYPIFAGLAAFLFMGERVTVGTAVGTALVIAGLWFLRTQGAVGFSRRGFICALTCAAMSGVSLATSRLAMATGVITSTALIFWKSLVVGAVTTSLWLVLGRRQVRAEPVRPADAALLVTSGVCSLGLGNYLVNLAMRTVSAAVASALGATTPLWAVLLARLLFGDRLSVRQWVGVVGVLVGTVVVDLF
ncbi:DMT family transporter [Jonquetella sp. BV3C21]|uniref:DMT family transporter n=1 Tax=Jonquetella sp. BV3C21 TaxID=1111126 RepID=UPI0003AD94AA|nr:DMT family transporter [Jonquetella sp. BV3C21]ERL24841.1 EamA-like transporter family protein [Jonquetella sp. BV3C21]